MTKTAIRKLSLMTLMSLVMLTISFSTEIVWSAPAAPPRAASTIPADGLHQLDCETGGQQCVDDADEAKTACTTQDMQAGMSQAQQAQAAQLAQQANQGNSNVASAGASAAAQCKNQADMSKILGGLSALKGAACTTAVGTCEESCEQVAKSCEQKGQTGVPNASAYMTRASLARKKAKTCSALSSNGKTAMLQSAMMMASAFLNNSCADASSVATPTPADCNNQAYAQVTQACICAPSGSNPYADPQNAICNNGQSVTGLAPSLSTTLGAVTPTRVEDETSEGTRTAGAAAGKGQSGNNTMEGGASGGGMTGGGGAGGGKMGGDEGGAAPSTIDKNVITGASGGGGGGLAAGGGGGGGAGNLGGSLGKERDGKIDLSQWLPKGKYKALNIGGMSIKADDGITGPMGPSIWEKVSNQYQQQKPSLIPDR